MFKQFYFYEMMKFKAFSLKHQEGYSLYFYLEGESMPSLSLFAFSIHPLHMFTMLLLSGLITLRWPLNCELSWFAHPQLKETHFQHDVLPVVKVWLFYMQSGGNGEMMHCLCADRNWFLPVVLHEASIHSRTKEEASKLIYVPGFSHAHNAPIFRFPAIPINCLSLFHSKFEELIAYKLVTYWDLLSAQSNAWKKSILPCVVRDGNLHGQFPWMASIFSLSWKTVVWNSLATAIICQPNIVINSDRSKSTP